MIYLQGYRSALRALYKEEEIEFPAEWDEALSDFYAGLERTAADQVQKGEREDGEGKAAMPQGAYAWVCRAFLARGDPFAHVYTVLAWNSNCRTNNVALLHCAHLSWFNDHLCVKIRQTKTDQGSPHRCLGSPSPPRTSQREEAAAVGRLCESVRSCDLSDNVARDLLAHDADGASRHESRLFGWPSLPWRSTSVTPAASSSLRDTLQPLPEDAREASRLRRR